MQDPKTGAVVQPGRIVLDPGPQADEQALLVLGGVDEAHFVGVPDGGRGELDADRAVPPSREVVEEPQLLEREPDSRGRVEAQKARRGSPAGVTGTKGDIVPIVVRLAQLGGV